ncbi:MAG: phosphoenolpyruvate-utilizing N-terminal domain-containing protein, partial [Alsobacter sp.]
MAERTLAGRPASPGLAAGPIHRLVAAGGGRVPTGDPAVEAEDLRSAIGHALVAVETLMNEVGGEAADVLGFQAALLSDDELTRPAFAAVAGGAPADAAWQAAMATEIAGYLAGEDEYFRARAADLEDLRDRVLDALNGGEAQATPPGAVLVAHDMPPSRFLAADWSAGGAILLAAGSATSHVAMLARSRGVPMVVGLGFDPDTASGEALVDGEAGRVVIDPDPATVAAFA